MTTWHSMQDVSHIHRHGYDPKEKDTMIPEHKILCRQLKKNDLGQFMQKGNGKVNFNGST